MIYPNNSYQARKWPHILWYLMDSYGTYSEANRLHYRNIASLVDLRPYCKVMKFMGTPMIPMLATTCGALWFGGAIDFGHHLPPSAWQKAWTPFHHSPRFNRIFKVTFHDMSWRSSPCFISKIQWIFQQAQSVPRHWSPHWSLVSQMLKRPRPTEPWGRFAFTGTRQSSQAQTIRRNWLEKHP